LIEHIFSKSEIKSLESIVDNTINLPGTQIGSLILASNVVRGVCMPDSYGLTRLEMLPSPVLQCVRGQVFQ